MSMVAIEARALCAAIGRRKVLHDLDLSIPPGRWTSIIGPNGAGKSTLLKVLAGLLPHQGEVRLPGFSGPTSSLRHKAQYLAWLGQSEHGADDLTVYDVALLGRLPHQRWLAAPSPKDHAAVRSALQSVHAWDWRERTLSQLSGGERQRVLLARALANEAEILLLDEPLTNLDPPHQVDFLVLIRDLVAQGKTVLSVLHELSLALLADEMVVMQAGRIVHQGACSSMGTHQAIEQVFDHRIRIQPIGEHWVCLPQLNKEPPT